MNHCFAEENRNVLSLQETVCKNKVTREEFNEIQTPK
jgi:hypothetical protein